MIDGAVEKEGADMYQVKCSRLGTEVSFLVRKFFNSRNRKSYKSLPHSTLKDVGRFAVKKVFFTAINR